MNPFGVKLRKAVRRGNAPTSPAKIERQISIKLEKNVANLNSIIDQLKEKGEIKKTNSRLVEEQTKVASRVVEEKT